MEDFYIGIKSCGCVGCAAYKDLEDIDDILEEWSDRGLTFELVDVEEARARLKVCKCQSNFTESKGGESMTNKYSVTTFAISLVDLDLLVNTEDKEERKKIADEVRKNEIKESN